MRDTRGCPALRGARVVGRRETACVGESVLTLAAIAEGPYAAVMLLAGL